MKKLSIVLFCIASLVFAACNNNESTENNESAQETEEVKTAKCGLSIGDKFAFAGLESENLVPCFAKEISETEKSLAGDHPQKDGVYFYTGEKVSVVSADQLNAYFAKVFETAKAASADGKLYEPGLFGDTKLRGEILETPKVDKSFGEFSCCFKNNDKWFRLDVSHKVQYEKFVKVYPGEKYYGVKVFVQEYNVTE